MSRRDAIDLGLMAMADLDQGLRDFRCEVDTVPTWMEEEADLP